MIRKTKAENNDVYKNVIDYWCETNGSVRIKDISEKYCVSVSTVSFYISKYLAEKFKEKKD